VDGNGLKIHALFDEVFDKRKGLRIGGSNPDFFIFRGIFERWKWGIGYEILILFRLRYERDERGGERDRGGE